jgi:prepilin-type processing-associated H-X9-DG protein/prepilin-type N-terminal cleavage/methylation domain-containing protein
MRLKISPVRFQLGVSITFPVDLGPDQMSFMHQPRFMNWHAVTPAGVRERSLTNCPLFKRTVGFTLVELLVVIGIIALLISILLPALSAARQASQRTACGAKLHSLLIAAGVHATDHKGFYPLTGELNGDAGNCLPANLGDAYCARYTYWYADVLNAGKGDERLLAPLNIALGSEMGYQSYLNNPDLYGTPQFNNTLERHFLCPSHADSEQDLLYRGQTGWLYAGTFGSYIGGCATPMSYVFNEAVLGFDDNYQRYRGNSALVRQPAKTMFACEGLPGSTKSRLSGTWQNLVGHPPPGVPPQPWGMYTMWNNQLNAPVTLSDVITHRFNPLTNKLIAGDACSFDQIRHRGKMNIAFCDGHVELRDIPPFTLAANGVSTTMKNDPNATALMNVYLLAP